MSLNSALFQKSSSSVGSGKKAGSPGGTDEEKKERAMDSASNEVEQLRLRMESGPGTGWERWRYVISRSEGLCP